MNIKTALLMASIFTVTSTIAMPLTSNDIFSAIDGEYDHAENNRSLSNDRVNFDLSPHNAARYSNTHNGNKTEFHFSLDVMDTIDPNESFEEAPIIWEHGSR